MPPRRRIGKRLFRSFLPIALVIVLAVVVSLGFIVYCSSRPTKNPYLVTPQGFSRVSGQVLRVTDETWTNQDGTKARGWLLKGNQGAPAIVLLHRYGTDRSWLFNLGVKLYETAGFTILWPDLRGHGQNPPVKWTSFGGREDDDVLSALNFLRDLKTENQNKLVGDRFGLYGIELGAYAALKAAEPDSQIKVLVLDSVPQSSDDVFGIAVTKCVGFENSLVQSLARAAVRVYLLNAYESASTCEVAAKLRGPKVLLLSGEDAGKLKDSTAKLQTCFQTGSPTEVRTDLPLSGLNISSATGEQGESYDRIVIEYFDRNLR
jgi:pimeloyl-ACP methyl ester carboxylesterase